MIRPCGEAFFLLVVKTQELAKAAVTNEARAKHYAMAAEYWRLAHTADDEVVE